MTVRRAFRVNPARYAGPRRGPVLLISPALVVGALLLSAPSARAQDKLDVSGGFFEKDMVNKDLFEGIDNGGGRKKRNLSQGIPDYNHQPRRKRRRSSDSFAVDSRELGSAMAIINGSRGGSGSYEATEPKPRRSIGLDIIPDLNSTGTSDGSAPPAEPAPATVDQFSVGGSPDLSGAQPAHSGSQPDSGILNGATLEQKANEIAANPSEEQSSAAQKAVAAGLVPGTPEYTQFIVNQVVEHTQGAKPEPASSGSSWRDRAQQNRAGSGGTRF